MMVGAGAKAGVTRIAWMILRIEPILAPLSGTLADLIQAPIAERCVRSRLQRMEDACLAFHTH